VLDRRELAGKAALQALLLRKRLGIGRDQSVSAIDSAEKLDIEVRLIDLPSMEGVYVPENGPKIVLSSMRPQGRRQFTCAHEIGHHVFGHGEQFDEVRAERGARRTVDPKEFIADSFAAYFLMPKSAIDVGMSKRRFQYSSLSFTQAFALASWLGVGYTTLIGHLLYGLRAIDSSLAAKLRVPSVLDIRADIAGRPVTTNLHVVDESWSGRAVDCEVGDFIRLPAHTICEGKGFGAQMNIKSGELVEVVAPGIGRVSGVRPIWNVFVRASRPRYVGRSCFRFEEEAEE
jgi:hypothetical protein